jgi:O-antigen/teichoic acid export membrane protein
VAAAALNLAANYFLIKSFGMLGAAWATALGFLAIAVGSYYCSQQVFRLPLPIGRVLRTLAMAVAIYLLSRVLPSSLATALLLKCVLIASFPALLWLIGCFSSDEMATLHSLREGAVRWTLRLFRPGWLRS